MKSIGLRTLCFVYHVLIVLLGSLLSCDSKAFDWGTLAKMAARDDDITAQDIAMPGVIPARDDQYMCTSVQMPKQDAYIVAFTPHASMKKAHHMLLYGCGDIASAPGEAYQCMGMGVCKGDQSSILFAWARDAPAPSIPEGVGFHVGGNSHVNYVTLQVHYGHKDAFEDGKEDFSGIELSITYQPQPYLAGIFLLISGNINVPPHARNYHSDVACEYDSNVPIYPFAFRTHAHELGKAISGYVMENTYRAEMTPIAKGDPQWPQAFYPMKRIEISKGDWLVARCTYDSDKDNSVRVGSTGSDEMCNLYLMYYTDAKYGKSFQVCSIEARGDIKQRIPEQYSNTPPAHMPDIIEQPPASDGAQESYYTGYDYRNPDYRNPLQEYRNQWQNMLYPDYQSDNVVEDNHDHVWPDDDDDGGHDTLDDQKAETEAPVKEVTTPVVASDKGGDGEKEETTEDIGSGKLSLADWHTDDSIILGQVAGLAVDAQSNVHVFHRADRVWGMESFGADNQFTSSDDGPIANNTVIAFSSETGKIVHQWGGKVDSAEDCDTCFNGFYLPHGLSMDHEGNIWMTDVALHQVFKFPPGGAETPLLMLGEKLVPGNDKDHFCKPADVAVDPNTGNFFVADGYCNSRIVKFSPRGEFLMEWGKVAFKSSGYPSDAFLIPHSLTFLKDKDVICVADREHGRIQCFDGGEGTYVDSYKQEILGNRIFAVHYNPWNGGVLYAVNGPSGDRVPVQGVTLSYGDKQVLQAWKPGNEEFQNPHDVECSADNTAVYVAEIGPNRVWKFDVDVAMTDTETCTNGCFNGGTCYYDTVDHKYRCACTADFDGPACENPFNPCDPNPCLNQGTCFKAADSASFLCSCATGFIGGKCEEKINPCSAQPCQNSGECVHSWSSTVGYLCTCRDGFSGSNCEKKLPDPCSAQPCQNSGECVHSSSSTVGYLCTCRDGFSGSNCEKKLAVVSCTGSCANNGTCFYSRSKRTFVCSCLDGFTGPTCQDVFTTPCQPNPCVNQGACFKAPASSLAGFICACKHGYTGNTCQIKQIVTEDTEKKEEIADSLQGTQYRSNNGKPVKSYQAQQAGLKAQTDDDLKGHKVSANDANTATTAIIVAVLAVPIVLMMMVAIAVRLRAQGRMKFGGNGLKVGYNSTSDRFSLGNFFNRRKGFNQVSTEDSDHDGGMEWSEESDIEEYSILNNTKTSQNL